MTARASDVFVGRTRELGELERAILEAKAGTGSTVLVAGEAGIGKSRLVSEVATRARDGGFDVMAGRSIDLVGVAVPYQPFVEALRPQGWLPGTEGTTELSRLRLFEDTLELLVGRAGVAPQLLVLEDLHWADTSTLDLVAYLANNLGGQALLLLATYRTGEHTSSERLRRFGDGVRRAASTLALELGPLDADETRELIAARAHASVPVALTDAIVSRAEGNPFFAEELLAAAAAGDLPVGLRELLLHRVGRLDPTTHGVLRLAAASGRDVRYTTLQAAATLPEAELRESLRLAVEHDVLVADHAAGTFRFRHALLAEAIYSTILPGEREDVHARIAEELARHGGTSPTELAPHWAAAGRRPEALAASVDAARQAEAVFGLTEAHSHLERALALWPSVPAAAQLTGLDLAALCAWTAEVASRAGAAPRAVELGRKAIELVAEDDPLRTASLHDLLGRFLHESGRTEAALAAFERAVELVPAEPPSAERAQALAALAHGLMLAWRFDESVPLCERARAIASAVGADAVERGTLLDLGRNLAYVGRADEGVGRLRQALAHAEALGDPRALLNAYVSLTDVLLMLGRPGDSARLGRRGLDAVRRFGIDRTVLLANTIEALLANGEWDEADQVSAAALRSAGANFPYMLHMLRADAELGRGDFDSARAHLEAALTTLREDRGQGTYDAFVAELALWERRWADADRAVRDSLEWATSRQAAQLRVWFCAKGLRAQAELAALARARRDGDALRGWLSRAGELIGIARVAAKDASRVTPNARAWRALAEAEHHRVEGTARPESWAEAAEAWYRLERPPLAAYCRWREAEALVVAGASRAEAAVPLRDAYGVATRLGAEPLVRELRLLAQRARLDVTQPDAEPGDGREPLEQSLGLTPREGEVLTLVARGLTDREIAALLVISVKTASVHVSHILRKLDVPNRLEAAAVAHRVEAPQTEREREL